MHEEMPKIGSDAADEHRLSGPEESLKVASRKGSDTPDAVLESSLLGRAVGFIQQNASLSAASSLVSNTSAGNTPSSAVEGAITADAWPLAWYRSRGWSDFGVDGGGLWHGKRYSEAECFQEALALDPTYAKAWCNLGASGGGVVNGERYSKAECYQEALALDPKDAEAWCNFGAVDGGVVNGRDFSHLDCFEQALAADPGHTLAWTGLGLTKLSPSRWADSFRTRAGRMLFNRPAVTSSPRGAKVNGKCKVLRDKVLGLCVEFWSAVFLGLGLLVEVVRRQCERAFDSIWSSTREHNPGFTVKFLLFAPLLSKPTGTGLSYEAQGFWTGYSFSRGTRPNLDSLLLGLEAEDIEASSRPFGELMRASVWEKDPHGNFLSSGACHDTKNDANFFTWASDFYASLKGSDPRVYIAINYEESRLKKSFLWDIEAPVMAEVCHHKDPRPAYVALDFKNACGLPIKQFFQRIQEACDSKRKKLLTVPGKPMDAVQLQHACACKNCTQPRGLTGKVLAMWIKAKAAIDACKAC